MSPAYHIQTHTVNTQHTQDDPRWYLADPICTFLFSVLVLWTTKNIMVDIFAVLMERAPHTVNPVKVRGCALFASVCTHTMCVCGWGSTR